MIQLLFRIFIKMQHLTDDLADAKKKNVRDIMLPEFLDKKKFLC